MVVNDLERALIGMLQQGLPLVTHPYAQVGAAVGMTEKEVIAQLSKWQTDGTIRRFGVVVRHHELGYQANAMVVWDVPDRQVQKIGQQLATQSAVTLCYRRPRRLPEWPYNLFSMIHGRDRKVVLQNLDSLIADCSLQRIQHEVLFSVRRYKQRGAYCLDTDNHRRAETDGE